MSTSGQLRVERTVKGEGRGVKVGPLKMEINMSSCVWMCIGVKLRTVLNRKD